MSTTLKAGEHVGIGPDGAWLTSQLVADEHGNRLASGLADVRAQAEVADEDALQYWTFFGVRPNRDSEPANPPLAYSLTLIPWAPLGWELPKTHGHRHAPGPDGTSPPELYEVLAGEGLFLIQDLGPGPTSTRCIAVRAREGQVVVMPPDSYHVSLNTGPGALIFGDVCSIETIDDYAPVKAAGGFAYFFDTNGVPHPNPTYVDIAELETFDAADWCPQDLGDAYRVLQDTPRQLRWLLDYTLFRSAHPNSPAAHF